MHFCQEFEIFYSHHSYLGQNSFCHIFVLILFCLPLSFAQYSPLHLLVVPYSIHWYRLEGSPTDLIRPAIDDDENDNEYVGDDSYSGQLVMKACAYY